MKILDFDLLAFGHFTDVHLDLSHGREGVQIIYGPNEAGKSTALRGLRALFYGIDSRSTDNFVHDYDKLRVGARVRHSDGTEFRFVRRKGKKNTFLDSDGKPADDSPLQRCLGRTDEGLFSTLFGINHERLVAGGRTILEGHGDVGQGLFAAGLGGTNLRRVLGDLDQKADELFRAQGQNQLINRACREYAEAKSETSKLSRASREYEELSAAVKTAANERDQALSELRRLRGDTSRLARIEKALQFIPERRALLLEIAQAGEVANLPSTFREERLRNLDQMEEATATRKRDEERIADVDAKLGAMEINGQLLEHQELVTDLHQRLGSHRKATKDLSTLKAQLRTIEEAAARTLEDLRPGFPLKDADRLRVSRLQHAKIQALSGDKQAIVSQLERAERDLKNAGEELEVAILEADKTGEVLEVDGLESVLRQAQKQGDLEEEIGQKRTVHESARAKCDRDLNRLGLWQGTLMELESLALPTSETIERFDKAWTDLQHTAVTLAERLEKVRADIASCDREIEALLLAGSVPSETDLEEARAHRELGWQLIRKAWLDGTEPDAEAIAFAGGGCLDQAYEASVHKADEISDRLRREANRVTQKAQLLAARQQHDAAAGEIMGDIKGNEESFAGIGKNWSSLWAPITPLPPREMLGWLQKQTRLLESAENLRLQEKSINELEKRVAQHMEHLGFALTSLGEKVTTKSLAGMIQQGESVLKKLTETARRAAQLRSETAKLKKRKDSAQGDKEEAERKLADWQEAWGKALGEIGLSESASPAVANEYLAGCGDLTRTLSDAISLRNRISGIERDAAQFIKDAKSAVQTLAPDLLETTDEEAVTRLQARVTKTAQDAATRGALIKQRDDLAQELQNAGDKIESVTGRLAAMCREAGCARYDELPAIEERSRQAEARRARLVQLNERLQAESAGAPLEEFVAEIEKIDPDAAKAQIMEHETQIAQWEGKRSQAEQDLGSRETTLKSFDGNSRAAESAERMQSILADIEENQDQYIRLRLASTILRREIEKYRAENQDPLLTRAGEFFSALTLRSFQGIATDFDASDNPILKGVRPSGKLMTVEEMSEGSRDQLFFALQLASIEKFIGGCEPLPFIADDVLISFDQEREAAVLEVLGELSKKTQVIVFTHHRHLVEIAQRTLASEVLQVHELTALKAGS